MALDPELTTTELRLHIGERIPNDGEEDDTNFVDEELDLIIARSGDNFYRILADCWAAKAGIYADLIDINEDGSDRKLSQAYDHCLKQAQRFDSLAASWDASVAADVAALRSVGRGFDAFSDNTENTVSIFSSDADYTRPYPLKRFPAIQ